MDEALRRFDYVNRPEGIILCLDADFTCDFDYLVEIEKWFSDPERVACSIYFEHPLESPDNQRVTEAIILYELHLRYYVQSLRFASFPYAFHTIGSSMAVRSDVYRKQGGMNKRQAGEDFYFLHKVIPLGGFWRSNRHSCCGFSAPLRPCPLRDRPRCRRVPGRPGNSHLQPSEFCDLKSYFEQVPRFSTNSRTYRLFLEYRFDAFVPRKNGFQKCIGRNGKKQRLSNNISETLFSLVRWLPGNEISPFCPGQFLSDQPKVYKEASTLFPLISGCDVPQTDSPLDLLLQYRRWERQNPQFCSG